jgi:hypothetical protein
MRSMPRIVDLAAGHGRRARGNWRHYALDKAISALAMGRISASKGAILMTSRISVGLVQKAAKSALP